MCVATHFVTGAQLPGTRYGISAVNIFILRCFGCCMCLVSHFVTGARFPGTCYEMSELLDTLTITKSFPGTGYRTNASNIFILRCFGCCMCLVSHFVTGARFPGTCYEMSELLDTLATSKSLDFIGAVFAVSCVWQPIP